MKVLIAIMTLFGVAAAVRAQVAPEATSQIKVGVSGTLTYSARYSQIAEFYGGTTSQLANLSGNFGYSTTSERHPTSITLGAGDSWGISGLSYNGGPYEDLSVSQGFAGQYSSLQLSDSVSYHRGIPIEQLGSTSSTAEPILTLETRIVDNDVNAAYRYKLSVFTSLHLGGSYNQLDYPDGNGLGTDSLTVNGGLNHRLNARNEIFGQYMYSEFSYTGNNLTIDANTALGGWQRTWTRRISSSVAAGPQWITFNSSTPIPSFVGYSVNASVTDTLRVGTAGLGVTHGVNGGGGYLYGSETDSVTGTFSRSFGHQTRSRITIGLAGGYTRTNTLGAAESVILGAQGGYASKHGTAEASRRLGRLFTAYVSYSGTEQSLNSSSSSGALSGLFQSVGFGIGFTPPQIHLRH